VPRPRPRPAVSRPRPRPQKIGLERSRDQDRGLEDYKTGHTTQNAKSVSSKVNAEHRPTIQHVD